MQLFGVDAWSKYELSESNEFSQSLGTHKSVAASKEQAAILSSDLDAAIS